MIIYIMIFSALIYTVIVLIRIAYQINERGKLILSGHYDEPVELTQDQSNIGAQLWDEGIDLFGSEASFLEWLNTPNSEFENQTPISYLSSIEGVKMVMNQVHNSK